MLTVRSYKMILTSIEKCRKCRKTGGNYNEVFIKHWVMLVLNTFQGKEYEKKISVSEKTKHRHSSGSRKLFFLL